MIYYLNAWTCEKNIICDWLEPAGCDDDGGCCCWGVAAGCLGGLYLSDSFVGCPLVSLLILNREANLLLDVLCGERLKSVSSSSSKFISKYKTKNHNSRTNKQKKERENINYI